MSKQHVRKKVVGKFLEELPGPADDETYNRYHYTVEKSNDWDIVLIRPANLKLGFDFRIDVTNTTFSKGTNAPSHHDFFTDLKLKHENNLDYAEEVRKGIVSVIDMSEPTDIIPNIQDENIGLPVEMLLKVSKWFAIEMDIRYWNGWGRTKYKVWLELMKRYNYRFVPKPTGYNFLDDEGKEISEKKATKLLFENE